MVAHTNSLADQKEIAREEQENETPQVVAVVVEDLELAFMVLYSSGRKARFVSFLTNIEMCLKFQMNILC